MTRKTAYNAATLTVTVTEAITLNSREYGSTQSTTFASIADVARRIVNVLHTAETEIITLSTVTNAGTFKEDKVMYIRVTNLDDTNHVALTFKNESNDEFGLKLDKGQTFIYNGDFDAGVVDTMDAAAGAVTPDSFEDLVNITAKANNGAVDLEVFIASIA